LVNVNKHIMENILEDVQNSSSDLNIGTPFLIARPNLFNHPTPVLVSLRQPISLNLGNYDLKIWMKKNAGIKFADYIKGCITTKSKEIKLLSDEEINKFQEVFQVNTPLDFFWKLTNFGYFEFNWNELIQKEDLPVSRTEISQQPTHSEIRGKQDELMNEIENFEIGFRDIQTISNFITKWSENLSHLIEQSNSFAELILPGSSEEIKDVFILRYDGNSSEVWLSTSTYYYWFSLLTS
jgi:hypothetical protein